MTKKNNNNSYLGAIITIGVIIIIALILVITTNQNQTEIKADYRKSVDSAIDDMDEKINTLFTAGKDVYDNIASECAWQARNLSTNIGVTCHKNAKIPWANYFAYDLTNFSVSYEYDDSKYADSVLDKGTSMSIREEGMQKIVDYGNRQYDTILGYITDMTQAMNTQCDWVDSNISSNVGSMCYDTVSEFSESDYSESPFSVEDYLPTSESSSE